MADEVTKSIVIESITASNPQINWKYTETHTEETDLDREVTGSTPIDVSVSLVTQPAYTIANANAGQLQLIDDAEQSYTEAGDYTFDTDEGNNTATVNLQTTYEVTVDDYSEELTLENNTVKGTLTLTRQGAIQNEYELKVEVISEGTVIATAIGMIVENLEEVNNAKVVITSIDKSTSIQRKEMTCYLNLEDGVVTISDENGKALSDYPESILAAFYEFFSRQYPMSTRPRDNKGRVKVTYHWEDATD